jgi:hypothetical protein
MRSVAPRRFVSSRRCGILVPASQTLSAFPPWAWPLPTAVPGHFRGRFILPRASHPLHSTAFRTCPRPGAESTFLGVPSLIATSTSGVHSRGVSRPRYVPSTAFLTPTTAYSATGLAGLFHPAAASRVHPSGVCSSTAAVRALTRRCPHAVEPSRLQPGLPLTAPASQPSPSGPCSALESPA